MEAKHEIILRGEDWGICRRFSGGTPGFLNSSIRPENNGNDLPISPKTLSVPFWIRMDYFFL